MTFDEWFVKYPLPAEIDTMDDTDREQWTWALRSAYKTGAAAEREACAKVCEDQDTGQRLPHDIAVIECAAVIRARGQA
jgi:hypothetical protein